MKHYSATRVAAIATLTCFLVAFAVPAAAAPWAGLTADGAWTASSILDWLHSFWAGWTGGFDLGDGVSQPSDGIGKIYDKARAVTEPDGVQANSPLEGAAFVGTDGTP